MNRRQLISVAVLHSSGWSPIVDEATVIPDADWGRDRVLVVQPKFNSGTVALLQMKQHGHGILINCLEGGNKDIFIKLILY